MMDHYRGWNGLLRTTFDHHVYCTLQVYQIIELSSPITFCSDAASIRYRPKPNIFSFQLHRFVQTETTQNSITTKLRHPDHVKIGGQGDLTGSRPDLYRRIASQESLKS